jgi:CubicO group peptidase (beta-lactamase class C family)
VRRVTGRSLGTFFAEEVAGPLGADFHIGLDAAHDHRVARIVPPPGQTEDYGARPPAAEAAEAAAPAAAGVTVRDGNSIGDERSPGPSDAPGERVSRSRGSG